MTDDYFDDYDAAYQSYAGTTSKPPMANAGASLDAFFTNLRYRDAKPLPDYNRLAERTGGQQYSAFAPAVGRVSQAAYSPAGPPQRYNVNLLGESISGLAESAPGQFLLGTPPGQRGGTMQVNTGVGAIGLATTPINAQNFATYAREAPLSLITSALGHNYQQPVSTDPYAKPAGPVNDQAILENLSEGDFGNVLDNIIDGVGAVGDAISAPFIALNDFARSTEAERRAEFVRDIARTGSTGGSLIERSINRFDSSKYNLEGIRAKAAAAGLSELDMVAELWDLRPDAVQAIFDNPDITDEQINKLVVGEPFSYDPGLNLLAELSVNIAPLLVGGGLVRGTGFVARGIGQLGNIGAGTAAAIAGPTRTAAAVGRVAETWVSLERAGLVGRAIPTAEFVGAWSLPRAWRGFKSIGYGLEKANRLSLIAGSGIRTGEWALKQAFDMAGYDEGVVMMDRWLWEMPLSNNPGLMLVDGFAVHPLRTAKTIYTGAKERASVKLFGGPELDVSPVAARNLGSIADMPLDVLRERVGDKLGWDPIALERLYGEDGPLSTRDLKNGLLHVAMHVVRERNEPRLRFLEAEADVVTRNEAFWTAYHEQGIKLLQSALTGRGKDADAIADAIKTEFWERAKITDASELGAEGFIGEYDGYTSLVNLTAWIKASKRAGDVHEAAVVALRPDVNTTFVSEFRARLETDYKPTDVVSARDLNQLRQGVPSIIEYKAGALGRRGGRAPRITRRQLEGILDSAMAKQASADLSAARPRTEAVPAIRPHEAESRLAIAKAFKLRQDTVAKLLDTPPEELTGPVSGDLTKVLNAVYRMTERDVQTKPDLAWQRVSEWWGRMYDSAIQRGEALDLVDRLEHIMGDRYGGELEGALDAEAFRSLRDALTHPYRADEKPGATAAAIAVERDAALSAFVDEAAAWLDDPARELRIVTSAIGTNVVEAEGFRATDVAIIEALAPAVDVDITPESLAILSDPLAHPLERVPPLREAIAAGWKGANALQERRLTELGGLETTYASLVRDVLGDDAVVSRETVDALTARAETAADTLDGLREQVRSLAGIIDRSPTRQLTGEVTDFLERAKVLGTRTIGKGKVPLDNWRSLPLEATGVAQALDQAAVDTAVRQAEGRLARQETVLATLDAEHRRITTRGDAAILADEVAWPEPALSKHRTRKEAVAAAKELRADGGIYGVTKVGSRWGVFRGQLIDRPAAPAAEAPPAPGPAVAMAAEPGARTLSEITGVAEPKFSAAEYAAQWRSQQEGYKAELASATITPARRKFLEQHVAEQEPPVAELEALAASEEAPRPSEMAPVAPEAPAAVPEAAPAPLSRPERPGGPVGEPGPVRASRGFARQWTPREFEALAESASLDAQRLQGGYSWEHLPVDRLDQVPDSNLHDLVVRADGLARYDDDAVPDYKPKVVKVKAQPELAMRPEGESVIPAVPAYYTYTTDALNKADQSGQAPLDTPGKGRYSTIEGAKAAARDFTQKQTEDLRDRVARAKHDKPFLDAELERRGIPRDAEGQLIKYPGSVQDAEAGYKQLAYFARGWSDDEIADAIARQEYGAIAAQRVLQAELVSRGAEPPPLPIVEQITEAQRVREAQVEAQGRQFEADNAALLERRAQYAERKVDPASHGFEEGVDVGPQTTDVTFLDPADNRTPIRSRVVLVDAADLLTSDEPGFPRELQPRARGVRASSAEQVQRYAADIQPDKLVGVTEGGSGMPIVNADGAVIAGNGRTMALRLASGEQFGRYKVRIQAEAGKYGIAVEDVNAMGRPMLVRELVDADGPLMERLAWQLNEMPIADLAPSVAAALTRADIREFDVGAEQSLAAAIRAPGNTGAVARMIGRLPLDMHSRYFDPQTGLNEQGANLLEAVLISKLLRADDRTSPGFESARIVVFQVAEQAGEEIKRISNGLAEGTAQVIKAYERAEEGAIGPDILTFGDDLAPALARIVELRGTGLSMEGVLQALDNVTAFDSMTLTPVQTHLAKLLAQSATQREVREFMRATADAALEAPARGQELMFADIPERDYTGMLNEGVRAWNIQRVATGKAEIDYFPSTEAPYDVPLGTAISESVIGTTEGPARMSQPLAADEVDAEVVRRTADNDPLVQQGDPAFDAIDEGARVDYPAFEAEVRDIADTWGTFKNTYAEPPYENWTPFTPEQHDFFRALLESANDGSATPAELLFLDALGGGFRRNAAGKLNMRLTNDHPSGWETQLEGLRKRFAPTAKDTAELAVLRARVEADQATRAETDAWLAKRKAKVIKPKPQKPLTREQLAEDVGPDVAFDVDVPAVTEAMAAAEHTVIVGDNPTVNRAVRRAVGAPAVEDGQRRVYEVHAPDARVMAERIEQNRLQALADVEAARAAVEEARTAQPAIEERASVFPDDETRGMWDRLMRGSDVDQLAGAIGSVEPTGLASVMDAIESIDRGVYADPTTGIGLTPPEAMQLRTHLMRLANGTLEEAITRKGVRAQSRFAAKLGTPVNDFDAEGLQDRIKVVMDDLAEVVKVDPDLPVIEGFLGAQYVLAKPPKGPAGTSLAPRILWRDRFAGDLVPGLTEELQVGRMEDIPRRVGNSRIARILDTIAGPRPEQQIRAQAVARFGDEIAKYVDEAGVDIGELDRVGKVVDRSFELWREHQEAVQVAGKMLYRRIALMGPENLNRMFDNAMKEVYGENVPQWRTEIAANGTSPAKLWRRADNRVRQFVLKSDLPISRKLEVLYGKAADLGEGTGRYMTVLYHAVRFLADIRWLALEAIEPLMLTLPRGGVGPVLEASVARKSGKLLRSADRAELTESTSQPLAFGIDAQQLAFREYAHWANVTDLEQGTAVRHRYMTAELSREQRRPFREIVKTMMREEPGLRRMVDESDGGDVGAFLDRLDRDWQLLERGTKEFATVGEAEAFFGRWLRDGVIDETTFGEFVKARRYSAHPAIDAELARTADPAMAGLLDRLAAVNADLFHNLTATFFGQENRSNIQRLANHPLLFWPISYQIKATKWLARFMFEEAAGVDTGASVAGAFQHVYDEHRRRWVADERYRAGFAANKTLYFIAGMLLPIIPTELGVSMSPWTRMMLYPDYERSQGIFGVGPIYTNLSLVPRLIAEQTKAGGLLEGLPEGAKEQLQSFFPQSITIGRKKPEAPVTSEIDAENQRVMGEAEYELPTETLTTIPGG